MKESSVDLKSKFLNENPIVKEISDPYPIWILDNFMVEGIAEAMLKEWPAVDDKQWNSGYATINGQKNILEQGVRTLNDSENYPPVVKEAMEYFHSVHFTKELERITGVKDLIPDTTGRWTNMRTMLADSFQMIHSDARRHPQNGLRKEITCLLYLNKDHDRERDGGSLEVWDDDMKECKHLVDPIFNRFVIFQNSDTAYHGVTQVKQERKGLTFSVMTDKPSNPRIKALFVARPTDDKAIGELGRKRAKVDDAAGANPWKPKALGSNVM